MRGLRDRGLIEPIKRYAASGRPLLGICLGVQMLASYTSHTIEHVKDDGVTNLFMEVFRVLEPGGVFRVTAGPDAEADYRALLANDANWFYWDEAYVEPAVYERVYHASAISVPLAERWLHHVATCLAPNDKAPNPKKYLADEVMDVIRSRSMVDALDFFTSQCPFNPKFPANHVSWWTHDKAMDFLRQAGFKTVYRSGYRQSASPLMRQSDLFDSTTRRCRYMWKRKNK